MPTPTLHPVPPTAAGPASRRRIVGTVGVASAAGALLISGCAATTNSVSAPPSASFPSTESSTVAHIVTKDNAGSFISPALQSGRIFVAQSKSGGAIMSWQLSDLPKSGSTSPGRRGTDRLVHSGHVQ